MSCEPWWYNETLGSGSSCPYGRRLPGDVTLPSDAGPLQLVAVVYSILPYAVVVFVVLEFLVKRGTRQLSIILFTAFITLLNEAVVKRLISQPRPGAAGPLPGLETSMDGEHVGSCNTTCGMPSSHACMAIGFLMLTLLDGIFRVVPSRDALETDRDPDSVWGLMSLTPMAPKLVMDHQEFVCFFCAWSVMLAPVPLMRVRLHDHSTDQVFVGGALGFAYALLWFRMVSLLASRWSSHLGRRFCFGLLYHNYGPPSFQLLIREPSGKWSEAGVAAKLVPAHFDGIEREALVDSDIEN